MERLFQDNKIDAVIHFAAFKAVVIEGRAAVYQSGGVFVRQLGVHGPGQGVPGALEHPAAHAAKAAYADGVDDRVAVLVLFALEFAGVVDHVFAVFVGGVPFHVGVEPQDFFAVDAFGGRLVPSFGIGLFFVDSVQNAGHGFHDRLVFFIHFARVDYGIGR